MASSMKWNGKEFEEHLRKATARGLLRAGTFYHQKCRESVSKPNTGQSVRAKSRKKLVSVESKLKKIKTKRSYFDKKSAKIRQVTQLRIVNQKKTKTIRGRSYTIYPNPSKPGEAPRLRTGFGRANVVVNHDPKGRYARIGVSKSGMYMFFLEVGTRHIARRPWLLKTLMENQAVIGKLAATGSKK